MEKKISCGLIVVEKEDGRVLACHCTGRKMCPGMYDIPKGGPEPSDASDLDTAIRELYEETGMKLSDEELKSVVDLGMYKYRPEKDLHIFFVEVDHIDIPSLKCTSTFESDGGIVYPEVDKFLKVHQISYFFKSLQPVLLSAMEKYLKEFKK